MCTFVVVTGANLRSLGDGNEFDKSLNVGSPPELGYFMYNKTKMYSMSNFLILLQLLQLRAGTTETHPLRLGGVSERDHSGVC